VREYRIPTIEYTLARDDQQKRNQTERQRSQARQDAIARSLVFVNRSGDPLTPHGLGQIIKRLGAYAGIEGVRCSPHTFRHTFAANFIRQGGDVYTLSKLLRHSSVSVTEEYLKTLQQQEARRGAKSVLDNL
jgi:integrase/recombinase XerD